MRAAHVGVLAMTGCRAAITHGYIRRRSEVIFTAPPLVGGVEDALCWSCCGYRPFRQRTRGLQRQLLRSVGAWFGDNGMTAKKRVGIGKRRKKPSREGRKGKGRRTFFIFFCFASTNITIRVHNARRLTVALIYVRICRIKIHIGDNTMAVRIIPPSVDENLGC